MAKYGPLAAAVSSSFRAGVLERFGTCCDGMVCMMGSKSYSTLDDCCRSRLAQKAMTDRKHLWPLKETGPGKVTPGWS